jgi:hypothetical protein
MPSNPGDMTDLPLSPPAAQLSSAAAIPIPKPVPNPGDEVPEWMNVAFAALSIVALILAVVWLRRRGGGGPWR